ncbi:hypothetical protein GCM10010873_26270 [Cypionkella aquatica]|uniref:YhdP central domain-containing protein n=1 Tax=Cypionkella aquatica TaxID=1756042 RepID=A0AA37TXE3_9RHOB|nr:DUF3971 domain-containing protein [Cypionkella aquatica]GLS87653.1 hypothetical protein GCM10010873_26270 [Cypionkella aquatica]
MASDVENEARGISPDASPVAGPEARPESASPLTPKADAESITAKTRKRHRTGLGGRLFCLIFVFGAILGIFALSGKPIPMPVWVVAEIEQRANAAISKAMPDAAIAIGGVEITVDGDWVPRLRLDDLRLLKANNQALLTLPDLRLTLDPGALLRGQFRARSLKIVGAHLQVIRDRDGNFDLSLGGGGLQPKIRSLPELFDRIDAAFASPAAASLLTLEAEALTLTLQDNASGRQFDLGDGRLRLENRAAEVAAEVSLSLIGGSTPARAVLTIVSQKNDDQARISAQIEGVAAKDVALMAAPFAWAGLVDAPISGEIHTTLRGDGIAALDASLGFGAGALQPSPEAQPVDFDSANMALHFDPKQGRMDLTDLSVQSSTLRMKASGHSYLTRADGSRIIGPLSSELPDAYLIQLDFNQVMFDPDGLFQEPVEFSHGAMDMRMRLKPFTLELGQLALSEAGRRLTASGKVGADQNGWRAAIDLVLNEIQHDRLVALWPIKLLPNTRLWVAKNVLSGSLTDVRAALRIEPGAAPRLHLGYNFKDADVVFVATLPPIKSGDGYASVDGQTYTMVLSNGTVTPPEGGQINVAGSVFAIPDVTQKPAKAEITLKTRSSLTAALSLLDQPPFHFMSKADQPVTLGQGIAAIETRLTLPLQKKIALKDVTYKVAGTVTAFSSETVVPGRKITADSLAVSADTTGLVIAGAGQIGAVPFNVTYSQGFALDQKGKARIEGSVTLSQKTASEFGLGLPDGMVSGQGRGQVKIDLVRGQPGHLSLVSDLANIGLAIPEVGWAKPPGATGQLSAEVRLGKPPLVESITLKASGLDTTGSVTMKPGGGLDVARFDRVRLGEWLDAPVEIRGRGNGKAVGLAVTGGSVDMRRMPAASKRKSSGKSAGSPLDLRLNSLRVAQSINLTNFRGDFSLSGGLNGNFIAGINGKAQIKGTVVPARNGTAVRLLSDDAGAVMAAAGIFASGRGGALDVTLQPRPEAGSYDGIVKMTTLRVLNTNVLAELLNAISVIGILEQLNGEGLLFSDVEANFLLTPNAVQVHQGSAIGASLGVSMAGVYKSSTAELFMQGTISPIYMLNGIGSLLTRQGEGVFGFNYELKGTGANPQVSVNPLSILTPGMFREIFRSPPPVIGTSKKGNGG